MSKFCPLPFTTLSLDEGGLTGPCCNSSGAFALSETALEKRWGHPQLQHLRWQHLNQEVPQACQRCYSEEAVGVKSLRNITIEKLKSENGLHTAEDFQNI